MPKETDPTANPTGNLYQWLLSQPRMRPPARPARASAAIVPWRRTAGGLEVFWVQRSPTMAFMGGWHAFPGGGVAKTDAQLPVAGSPTGVEAGPVDGALPETVLDGQLPLAEIAPPGLVAAALRELFEETGLLLWRGSSDGLSQGEPSAESSTEAVVAAAAVSEARRSLLARERSLLDWLVDWNVELDASRLVYCGRWLTPPLAPFRFDNRFFLLEWPKDEPTQPAVDGGELVFGEWLAPEQALERWQNDDLLTAPPIVHTLTVLADASPSDGPDRESLSRLRAPSEQNLGPYRKVEFRPGVILLPLSSLTLPPVSHTNCYLLGFGDCVLVDPGTGDDRETERLIAALEACQRQLGRTVRAVWLTHHHRDHVGAAEAVADRFQLPIEAHPDSVAELSALGVNVQPTLVDGRRVRLLGRGAPDRAATAGGSEASSLEMELPEMELEILHTPGHARGHVAIHEPHRGWIACGDLVAGTGTIVIDPPDGNMNDYITSLERLLALGSVVLFPGHGPVIRDSESKLRGYVDHRNQREESIAQAYANGKTSPSEIVKVVYEDVPEKLHPVAERQILAHLDRLRHLGRIQSP